MLIFFAFVIGIIFGSFASSLIYRLRYSKSVLSLSNKQSILFYRSFCPYCKHILTIKDLIPIISYIINKGKCRHCGHKIPSFYLYTEIVYGILFMIFFIIFGWSKFLLFYLVFFSIFLLLTIFDCIFLSIPIYIVYAGIVIMFILNLFLNIVDLKDSIYTAVILTTFWWGIKIIYPKGIGSGDIPIAFFIGLSLGSMKTFIAMEIAIFVGAIISIILIILKRAHRKTAIPLIPFFFIGSVITIIYYDNIMQWIIKYFFN